MTERLAFYAAVLILVTVSSSPVRLLLEQSLVSHLLIQMPALVLCGWTIARRHRDAINRGRESFNVGGATGLSFALIVFSFWMLPRSVDGSVQNPLYEFAKFVTLPFAGASLALSWPKLPPLAIGILKCNLVSMMLVLSWIYTTSPSRLCNSYLRDEQDMLGQIVAVLAIGLGCLFGGSLFCGTTTIVRRKSATPIGSGGRE